MSILAANGRLNLDTFSTEFIKTFWAPSAVTIGWLIQYGMVDAICVGASRNYFKWGFPKGAEGAPDPLRRAMRVHMNQAENSMVDSCAPTVRLRVRLSGLGGRNDVSVVSGCTAMSLVGFAATCGAVWVALRHMYGFTYRMTKGSLKAILKFTLPSYAVVQTLYFKVAQRILQVAFDLDDIKSHLVAGGGLIAVNLFTLGVAMCQRKHCEVWDKNQKEA